METTEIAREIRRLALEAIHAAGSGHPGGSLSVADILAVLYGNVALPQPYDPEGPERDIVILSKGHACPALYATGSVLGYDGANDPKGLRKLRDSYQGHPDLTWLRWVETSTGSLGQGFGVAVGWAMALKDAGSDRHVYVVVGDGELHEGLCDEVARLAAAEQLDNLTCVVDHNKHQSDRASRLTVDPVWTFQAHGWHVVECYGHDHERLAHWLTWRQEKYPVCLVARTIKGKGVKWMEGPDWHGSVVLSDEQLEKALEELK